MERNGRDREQLKVIHGLLVQGAKCANSPRDNLECTRGIDHRTGISGMGHEQQRPTVYVV